MDYWADTFLDIQSSLFEQWVKPFVFDWGMGHLMDLAFDATAWFLIGLIQVIIMLCILVPLEKIKPVEKATFSGAVGVDVIYTLIHRLGFFRLVFFFSLEPILENILGYLRVWGLPTWHLDDLWSGVSDIGWVSFCIYLVIFDFANYWIHRAQHFFSRWWALHALHHSQTQMTLWTDNRNHLLDDGINAVIAAVLAQALGLAPTQYVAMVALTQLIESFQHANVRIGDASFLSKLLISPQFHRLHHANGVGHESPGQTMGGHNFGVLFPWWDMIFSTALFKNHDEPTGVRSGSQTPNYAGQGLIGQQMTGLRAFFHKK
ncbi:MAG: fatty acid hydroxylase family protein [Limnohabitans sp.]|nr:fatty acid hydroxylase family protein [Limnohabitans sp.]